MKKRTLSFMILILLLTGCIRHEANLNIRPSAVPGKVLTKTAIPPLSAEQAAAGPDSDPWATCSADIDSDPILRRVSELVPEAYRRRVQITFMIQNDEAPSALIAQRCMNGKVYVCLPQEGRNCHDRLNFSTEPSQAMLAACEYPELEGKLLSSVITDRYSAYLWTCQDGQPVIAGPAAEVDSAGYDSSIWTEIPKGE